VVITIRLDAVDPPAGRARREGRPELAFSGWLGLLRVLAELMAAPDAQGERTSPTGSLPP
jgi:hypothetical protein